MASAPLDVPVIPPPLPTTPVPSRDGAPIPSPRVSSAAAAFAAASAASEAATPDIVFADAYSDSVAEGETVLLLRGESHVDGQHMEDMGERDDMGANAGAGSAAPAVVVENDYAVPLRKPERKKKAAEEAVEEAGAEAQAPRAAIAPPAADEAKRASRLDRIGAVFSRFLDRDKDDRAKSEKQAQRLSWNPTSDGAHSGGHNDKQHGERTSLMAKSSNFIRRSFRVKSAADIDSVEDFPPLSPHSPTSLPPLSPLSSEGNDPDESLSVSVACSRASVFAEELVSSLACASCARYMQAPIEQCRRGHNVCKYCRERAIRAHMRCPAPGCTARLAGLRNRLAEEVAAKLLFPCAHAHAGCSRQVPSDELEFHEPRCPYRVYKCLINVATGTPCAWEGRRVELEEHVRTKHSSYFSSQETTKWRWAPNLVIAMQDYQLLSAHGEIFWYCAAQDPRRMRVCWFVAFVGPDTRSLRYTFTYKLTSSDGRIIEIACPTLPDYVSADAVIESGRCADLSYSQALSMMDEDGKLNFSITLNQTEP